MFFDYAGLWYVCSFLSLLICMCAYRTFTHNMLAFGLSKKLCNDFLKKQAIIGNLNEGEGHAKTHIHTVPVFFLFAFVKVTIVKMIRLLVTF